MASRYKRHGHPGYPEYNEGFNNIKIFFTGWPQHQEMTRHDSPCREYLRGQRPLKTGMTYIMDVKNINSLNAYSLIMVTNDAILVDVRTQQEWKKTGVPCLNGSNKVVFLSWQLLPDMSLNRDFEAGFMASVKNKKSDIFFICRSGHRSFLAATFVTALGYESCYNITDGFEGNNTNIGWKQNNLPWQI